MSRTWRLLALACAVVLSAGSLYVGDEGPAEVTDLYESCHSTFECVREAEACIHTPNTSGVGESALGLCTFYCETDEDCPEIGECVTLHEGTKICARPCGDGCPDELNCHAGHCKAPVQ